MSFLWGRSRGLKKVLTGLVCLSMLAGLSACSGNGNSAPAPTQGTTAAPAASQETAAPAADAAGSGTGDTLIMGTGSTGTGLYGMGASISNAIRHNSNFQVTAQTTGGTPANINLLATDQVDMIIVSGGDQDVLKEIPDACLLYVATPYAIQFGMEPGSAYTSIESMKGCRLAVPVPGTGGYTSTENVFDALGVSFDDFKTSFMAVADSDQAFKDGKVDVMGQISSIPHPGWLEISTTGKGIDIYQFSDEELSKIAEKYPDYTPTVVPAGTYKGQDKDIQTLGLWARIICTADLSEEQAYEIAKVMDQNHEEVVQGFGQLKDATVENTIAVSEKSSIPLHPGVVKYFKEIGAMK